MIDFRPCALEHIRYIEAQTQQRFEYDASMGIAEEIVNKSIAMSAWDSWRCVAAAGVFPVWPGRAVAWACMSKHAYRHLIQINKRCLFVLDSYPAKRVEMTVRSDFPEAHRWARMLGFVCETPNGMEGFYPNGETAYLYARIK